MFGPPTGGGASLISILVYNRLTPQCMDFEKILEALDAIQKSLQEARLKALFKEVLLEEEEVYSDEEGTEEETSSPEVQRKKAPKRGD